jgi:hypothetical protein
VFAEILASGSRDEDLSVLPAHLVAPKPTTAPSRGGAPPVSVVIAHGGSEAVHSAIAALGETLPGGSELLFAGVASTALDELARARELTLRPLDVAAGATEGAGASAEPSEAEILSLGVHAAAGRMVLFVSGTVLRCDPWHAPFARALDVGEVGGVAPLLRTQATSGECFLGREFADEDLRPRPLAGRAGKGLVPEALLADACCAFKRAVLAAAGGVDRDFISASAAIAELSVRLWRMGFRCCVVPQVEVWTAPAPERRATDSEDAGELYERLRIAALHLDPERLAAFTERARALPAYDEAAARLSATDVQVRRAAVDAICAFGIERYLTSFPLRAVGDDARPVSSRRLSFARRRR